MTQLKQISWVFFMGGNLTIDDYNIFINDKYTFGKM